MESTGKNLDLCCCLFHNSEIFAYNDDDENCYFRGLEMSVVKYKSVINLRYQN